MIHVWSNHVIKTHNGGTFELTENPVSASYIHPGLALSDFQPASEWNLPKIANLMHLFTEVRNLPLFAYHGPDGGSQFLEVPRLLKDRLMFVISTELDFKREFYDSKFPKWPLKVTVSLGYIGTSSFSILVELAMPGTTTPLCTQTSTYITVDPDTRTSKSLPNWFREKFSGRGILTTSLRVETLSRPSETFHFESLVMWSDTDKNRHTNYSTYVHYTMNALRAALALGGQHRQSQHPNDTLPPAAGQGLKGITMDIVDSGIKNLRICYSKESFHGDKLDTYLWQESGNQFGVKAVVEKAGETLCHVHLQFFDNVASHL